MLSKLKSDIFLRNSAIYFTGSMVVAFLNYVFYPIIGRLLPPTYFGDVQVFISLITQFAIISGAFSIVTVNIVANIDDPNQRNAIISELQKVAFLIVGILSLFLCFFVQNIMDFFNFSSAYLLFVFILILPVITAATFRGSYLQGAGRFIELSLAGVIASLGRIIFTVSFVLLGAGAVGVPMGILIANAVMLIYLFYKTKDSLHLDIKTEISILDRGYMKNELKYGALVLVAIGFITILFTADILLVKHYFNSIDAGLYSGISAVARIIFYAMGSTTAVLFASIKTRRTFEENSSVLGKSFIVLATMGGCGLLMFYLFGEAIVSVLMGGRYATFTNFLLSASLLMFLISNVGIFIYYFLALRRYFLIPVSLIGVATTWLLLLKSHANIYEVLNSLILSTIIILFVLVSVYAKDYFNHRSSLQ